LPFFSIVTVPEPSGVDKGKYFLLSLVVTICSIVTTQDVAVSIRINNVLIIILVRIEVLLVSTCSSSQEMTLGCTV
jgi:hypothetical protein